LSLGPVIIGGSLLTIPLKLENHMDAITPALRPPTVTTEQALTIKTTHTAGRATAEDSPVLHAAIGLTEQIRAASDEIERSRRLPPGIAAAMKDAGVFGMAMPRVWGGPELDPLTQFRVIEALAMADASVGWCAMIGCDGGYVTAFLDQDVARAMYPDPMVATGAAATTTGKAIRVPGGLPCQRPLSVCQRVPALRMGLVGLHHRGKWRPERRWQRRAGNPAVSSAVVTMRNPGHVAHHRAARHRQQ
jgi:acyl-CoA dehydrogenase-like protein